MTITAAERARHAVIIASWTKPLTTSNTSINVRTVALPTRPSHFDAPLFSNVVQASNLLDVLSSSFVLSRTSVAGRLWLRVVHLVTANYGDGRPTQVVVCLRRIHQPKRNCKSNEPKYERYPVPKNVPNKVTDCAKEKRCKHCGANDCGHESGLEVYLEKYPGEGSRKIVQDSNQYWSSSPRLEAKLKPGVE